MLFSETAAPSGAQLDRLTEVSRALTNAKSLDEVCRLTVERGAFLLGADAAVLMIGDEEGLFHVRAAHGIADEMLARFHTPRIDDVTVRLCGLLNVDDGDYVAVPLVAGGNLLGIVAVAKADEPTDADEWLLSSLADQAAAAFENARLSGEVRLDVERMRDIRSATNAKDRALSTLAHDIRTPLGAIEGYCGILDAEIYGPINEKQRETVARVRMSGQHLLALLDNVMDMARLNAGVTQVALEPVRLADTAREAVELLMAAAEAKQQTLTLQIQSNVVVSADHNRLRQVLVNLIGNAVKFTPPLGSITVLVCDARAGGAAFGDVQVTDTGSGIPHEEQKAIFEPYYRTDDAANVEGIGLGLAISQALVSQMAGTMALESEPGIGSRFILRFASTEP